MEVGTRPPSPVRRILAVAAAAFGVAGFAAPLVAPADPTDRSLWLLEAIPGFAAAAATEPLVGILASVAIAGFAVVLLVVVVIAILFAARPASARWRRVLQVAAVVLLVGCVGAALLVAAVSGGAEGRALPISPAVACAVVSGVLALVAVRRPRATS